MCYCSQIFGILSMKYINCVFSNQQTYGKRDTERERSEASLTEKQFGATKRGKLIIHICYYSQISSQISSQIFGILSMKYINCVFSNQQTYGKRDTERERSEASLTEKRCVLLTDEQLRLQKPQPQRLAASQIHT